MEKEIRLTKDGWFFGLLWRIALPAGLAALLPQAAVIATNNALVRSGTYALAAYSVAWRYEGAVAALLAALNWGGAVAVAQYRGRGDFSSARRTAALLFRITCIAGAACTLLVLLLAGPLSRMMAADPEVIALSSRLLRFLAVSTLLSGAAQAVGISMLAMGLHYIYVISQFAGLAVRLAAILTSYGIRLPGSGGIYGIGIASLLGSGLQLVLAAALADGDKRAGFSPFRALAGQDALPAGTVLRYALPIAGTTAVGGLASMATTVLAGRWGGAEFLSYSSMVTSTQGFVGFLYAGLPLAGLVAVGAAAGAGQLEKAWEYGITLAALALGAGAVGGGLMLLTRSWFAPDFITRELGVGIYLAGAAFFLFQSLAATCAQGYLRGRGDVLFELVAVAIASALSIACAIGAGAVGADPLVIFITTQLAGPLVAAACIWRIYSGGRSRLGGSR